MKRYLFILFGMMSLTVGLEAKVRGRAEIAPLYMHIDVIQDGQTNQRIDMYGTRTDATILPFEGKGICLKPFYFGGWGNGSNLQSYGLGLGHYTPLNDRLTLIPLVGVGRSHLHTHLDVPQLSLYNLKERFRSYSFNIGTEVVYKLNKCLYFTLVYQYAWARTKTFIGTPAQFQAFVPPVTRGESAGSNFAVLLDYYIKECLAISAGYGQNNSLSKERHGLKGMGVKLGIAYLF